LVDLLENESNQDNYPNYFKCPISWEKMENPVISMEGHSYEKWAIDKWLYTQQTSPITGLILNDNTLISNYTLKSAIDDFHKRQQKLRRNKIDLQKFLTKCEYDLSDLKKYFNRNMH
jgi:hypothetical protein